MLDWARPAGCGSIWLRVHFTADPQDCGSLSYVDVPQWQGERCDQGSGTSGAAALMQWGRPLDLLRNTSSQMTNSGRYSTGRSHEEDSTKNDLATFEVTSWSSCQRLLEAQNRCWPRLEEIISAVSMSIKPGQND